MMARRLIRLEDLKTVKTYVRSLMVSEPQLDYLLQSLHEIGRVLLIGGAIRDIPLGRVPRDLDLIVESSNAALDEIMTGLPCRRNRFGGYKITVGNWEVDIWTVLDSWAVKSNFVPATVDMITSGVFFDLDALTMDLFGDYYDVDLYNKAIESGVLDIVLDDTACRMNPTRPLNVLKALVLMSDWDLRLSDRLCRYIEQWLETCSSPVDALHSAAENHYRSISRCHIHALLSQPRFTGQVRIDMRMPLSLPEDSCDS